MSLSLTGVTQVLGVHDRQHTKTYLNLRDKIKLIILILNIVRGIWDNHRNLIYQDKVKKYPLINNHDVFYAAQ